MPTYVAQWNYKSSYGQYSKGDKPDLAEDEAAQINVDSPGVLVLATAVKKTAVKSTPKTRELTEPDNDRQVKNASVSRSRPTGK